VLSDKQQQELAEQTAAFWDFHEKKAERRFTTDIENMSLEEYGKQRKSLGVKNLVNYDWDQR